MKQKVALILKLPQLQNLIKRDPTAYKDEFLLQSARFQSELDIFKLKPTSDSERFTELVTFMSHVASYYKELCAELPMQLLELVETHATTFHPDVRAKLFQALILMRNRSLLDPLLLIKLSFKLISVPDKTLRENLGEYIFNDIKTININKNNDKLNRNIQALLFNIVSEDATLAARKTVEILSDLYRKRIWTDARTVNVLACACTSNATRVMVAGIHFFLGIESKMMEDEEEQLNDNMTDINYHEHSKKTKKRFRQVKKQQDRNKKVLRDKNSATAETIPLFPAIQLINNPQTLAEKLLSKLRKSGERFEVKLLILNFVSRLIGCHGLILLSFYSYHHSVYIPAILSFIQKYLTSHQKEVTRILAYLIQACHDLVPPEDLMPLLKSIAHNFITERCTNEVITVGINSVREILVRAPALLHEPGMADFIQDLAMYSRKTHKSVMIAAHGVVNFVREAYPILLRRSDRGKFHDTTHIPAVYGQSAVSEGVEGIELLEAYERGEIRIDEDGEVIWGNEDEEQEEVEEEEEDDDDNDDDDDDNDDEEEEEEDDGSEDEGDWVDVDEDLGDVMEEVEEEGEEGWEEADDDDDNNEEEEEEEEEVPVLVPVDNAGNSLLPSEGRGSGGTEGDVAGGADSTLAAAAANSTVQQRHIDATRILTSEDFLLIAKLRASLAEKSKDPRLRSKKFAHASGANDNKEEEEDGSGVAPVPFAVVPESLASSVKSEKTSKIERITSILKGRNDKKFDHGGHAGGLTNTEKERKKNYVMVRKGKKSVANKIRVSNSDVRYKKMHAKEQFGRDRRKRRRT